MLADTLGRPLRFRITPGQASDIDLLEGQQADAVLADKAYYGNDLRYHIKTMNAKAAIRCKRNRKVFIPHEADAYKHRSQVERCFNRLKHFRRFATVTTDAPSTSPASSSRRCHNLALLNVDPA